MTVWGLLSDIHGNLPALHRAIERCREHGAERFAVLGDNLGRGDSDGCVALVRSLADVSVQGNRDLDWAERVGPAAKSYVLGLPRVVRTTDFIAAHGDDRLERDVASSDIRRGFARTRARLERDDTRLALFGHTHRARVWRLSRDGEPVLLHDAAVDPRSVAIDVAGDPDDRFVVNVGTVGLPFPGKGPPSCAVYDGDRRRVLVLPLA